MKNMKISKKFLFSFGIILLVFVIVSVFAIVSLQGVLKNFSDFHDRPYQNVTQVMDLRRSIQSAAKYISYATMTTDLKQTQEFIDAAQEELDILENGVEFLRKNFPGDQALVETFFSTMQSSTAIKENIYRNALALNNDLAVKQLLDEYRPILLTANEQLLAISDYSSGNATRLYAAGSNSAKIALIVVISLVVLTFLLTIGIATHLAKSLVKPIIEMEKVAQNLAAGKIDMEITYVSRDELGNLAQSTRSLIQTLKSIIGDVGRCLGDVAQGNFNTDTAAQYSGQFVPLKESIDAITHSLSDTLGQINQAADQVSSGSGQVSSGAQALSQGATEQASSVEELSATIMEISSQINLTAENAQMASQKAGNVGVEAADSNDRMREMLRAMDDISKCSSEISKIIKTIEDIAFQTNILALNAAVEAARAGAAGKGFAVVADEVRNLASKSAEASKSTAALIESSLKAVENGTKIADQTAQSLGAVVVGVKDANDTIDKISLAAKEQAIAIVQVTTGVEQISSVVQTNSATAEESAAASEELSGQADMLKGLVGQFRLKSTGSPMFTEPARTADPSPKEHAMTMGGKY